MSDHRPAGIDFRTTAGICRPHALVAVPIHPHRESSAPLTTRVPILDNERASHLFTALYRYADPLNKDALTTQVLSESEWTPSVLSRRQQNLLGSLKREWRLLD